MLVLSRKPGERILIRFDPIRLLEHIRSGRDLAIDVICSSVKPGSARIGFEAPDFVQIMRAELPARYPVRTD